MTLEILDEVACIINNYMIINDTSGVVNDVTIWNITLEASFTSGNPVSDVQAMRECFSACLKSAVVIPVENTDRFVVEVSTT